MTKVKPFGANLLVEPVVKKQVLVADRQTLCEYGKVIDMGDDVNKHGGFLGWFGLKKKNGLKVGDTVGFLVWGLNHLEIDEKRYYFVPESDEFILGTIENE